MSLVWTGQTEGGSSHLPSIAPDFQVGSLLIGWILTYILKMTCLVKTWQILIPGGFQMAAKIAKSVFCFFVFFPQRRFCPVANIFEIPVLDLVFLLVYVYFCQGCLLLFRSSRSQPAEKQGVAKVSWAWKKKKKAWSKWKVKGGKKWVLVCTAASQTALPI